MKQPIEVLFDTCFELLGKRSRTLDDFQQECERDQVMGEGVSAICEAMKRYCEPLIQEIQCLNIKLNEERRTAMATINLLHQEIAELRKDSVIVGG